MIKKTQILDIEKLDKIYDMKDINSDTLFFDIETTGLSAKSAICYLLGGMYIENNSLKITQWLAENSDDESLILQAFSDFSRSFKRVIHYNGTTFDLPFLRERFRRYKIQYNLDNLESIDIYTSVRHVKKLLELKEMKQKSIESFLEINREDNCSGKELIEVFKHFITTKDNEELLNLLLLHNRDDVIGLLLIYPIMNYEKLISCNYEISDISLEEFENFEGDTTNRLLITATFGFRIPKRITLSTNIFYIIIEDNTIKISIAGISDTLKFFFDNYKDYYYLIDEDVAMHKSIAAYVDKAHRKQATAATCYTKKNSLFFLQPDRIILPAFQMNHGDKDFYFEYNEKTIITNQQITEYIQKVLRLF